MRMFHYDKRIRQGSLTRESGEMTSTAPIFSKAAINNFEFVNDK
jgi:hypothetical protein